MIPRYVYQGRERREASDCELRDSCPMMEESVVESIAEKAAEKAIGKLTAHVYQGIGRNVVQKMLYIVGAAALGMSLWLQSKGFWK